jgi:O-antigen/teichoic acid export membrane protein
MVGSEKKRAAVAPRDVLGKVTSLARSSSVQAAVGFTVGGIVFALATLLLARYMAPAEFGLLMLLLALVQFGIGLGPFGVDLVINRHRLPATGALAARVLATATLAGLLISAVGFWLYAIDGPLLTVLCLTIIAAALSRVAAAFFQSAERFGSALVVTQMQNVVLLLAVPLALLLSDFSVMFFAALVLAGYAITTVLAWLAAAMTITDRGEPVDGRTLLLEGLGGLGIGFAVLVMMMLERYLIPIFLTLEAMATFSVLASVVGAPFRMMQIAIAFTLLPRLRAATSRGQARRLIRSEILLGAFICVVGTAVVLTLGPWVIHAVVGDRYDIPLSLYIAAILAGYAKILQGTAVSVVNALGNARTLHVMSTASWSSIGVAIAASWALSSFGLEGIIYGVGIGWLAQALVAVWLSHSVLDQRFGESAPPSPAAIEPHG